MIRFVFYESTSQSQIFEQETFTYTYIIGCEETREAAVIDPVLSQVDLILDYIKELDLKLVKTTHGIDILVQLGEPEDTSFFTSSKFDKNITFLLKSYDQIFISPKKHETIPALNKLKAFDPTVILLTKVKKTKRLDLLNLKKTYPIGIMFNE